MEKMHYIATPTLINFLQGGERSYNKDNGTVHITYDKNKVDLEAFVYDDDHTECTLVVGGVEIDIRPEQKDHVFSFVQEFYKDEREKHSEDDIQDHKDDLSFDNIKEDQFS
jgi:hypothetical protein